MNWKSVLVVPPPEHVKIMTKIDDEKGVRNVQTLVCRQGIWYFPDFSMYVYYVPTHWAYIDR